VSAPALERDLVREIITVAAAMNCFVAVVGQRNARKAGSTLGFPDLALLCAGQVRLIELKRTKAPGQRRGVLSLGQEAFIARAAEQHVHVFVIDDVQQFISLVNACRRPRE